MTISSTFSNVNVGTVPNDGTGDPLRTSFIKINENFQYINEKIWPNLEITPPSLTADITSSYISDFNLITATDILVTKPGGGTITANVVYPGSVVHSVAGSTTEAVDVNVYINVAPTTDNTSNLTFTVVNVGTSTTFVTNVFYNAAVTGTTRTIVFQNNNASSATRYLVLPNKFNNKGVANITMASYANVMVQFIAFDDTTSNVYAFVAN